MLETFDNLLKRSLNIKPSIVGDPFEVIPVKNNKYAKNTTEIHLGEKGLEALKNFDLFPNLECLWLNNNKFTQIEGLEKNYRIKELYLHNNKLRTLEGCIENLVHLRTLTLYNNELRGLDKNLEIICKFTQLASLDMFGNPLAEEPNYRLRVIFTIPSLKVFDRHVITLEERRKANVFMENEKKEFDPTQKKKKKQLSSASVWNFSQCEKELDDEANKLKKRYEEEEKAQKDAEAQALQRRFKRWYKTDTPLPTFLSESSNQAKSNQISEWDKNLIMALFRQYDKDKKGIVNVTDIDKLLQDLIEDKAMIGLIPDCDIETFKATLGLNDKNNLIKSEEFRMKINALKWIKCDPMQTRSRVENLYSDARKLIYMGKPEQANDILFKATRLEKTLS